MADEWIVLVEGREYGPADLATLREWKTEGRVLASNQARSTDSSNWTAAATIPGLFEAATPPPIQQPAPAAWGGPKYSLLQLLGRTAQIYGRGFFQYLCLTLLVVAPSLCAQLAADLVERARVQDDLRALVEGGFAFGMTLLVLVLWPVYIAGIQIVTAELAGGDRISFLRALNAAMRFWPRVAGLSLVVYLVFLFLVGFGFGISVVIALGSGSLIAVFFALVLLVLQIWLFSRWFVFTLFWQQTAVLGNAAGAEALRLSNEVARSGRDLAWHRRPLWRGAIIASLWVVFVLGLYWPVIMQSFHQAMHLLGTNGDLQSMLATLKNQNQVETPAAATRDLVLWLIQKLFQPLVGIAFVLVYLDRQPDAEP